MGYIFDFNDTKAFEEWCRTRHQIYDFGLQSTLMMKMLTPYPGRRVLDVGCGGGRSLQPVLDHGCQVTGVDPSPYMLDLAVDRYKNRVSFHRAFAEDLPFDDNAFDYTILMNSLEFTERPAKAVEEACRVTREKIFIGVFNRNAPLILYRRAKGGLVKNTFSHARAFGIWELKKMVLSIMGNVPITWRTTLQFPCFRMKRATALEKFSPVQRLPMGTFVGMTITPVPRFRTRTLPLRICPRNSCGPLTGFARNTHHRSKAS